MKLGFSSLACPEWGLETIISRAATIGFTCVELHGLQGNPHLPSVAALTQDPSGVAARFRDANVELVCLGSGASFGSPEKHRLDEEKARATEVIALAGQLGCPFVRFSSGPAAPREQKQTTMLRMIDVLRDLAQAATDTGTTILLENDGGFPASRDTWFIIDSVGHPAVRCCWNTCRSRLAGERPTITVPRLGRMIGLVHTVDARITGEGALDRYELPGDGSAELDRAVELLHGIVYQGPLVFAWPKSRVASLAAPDDALPAAFAKLKEMLDRVAATKELSAYKGDKNAPRYAPPGPKP